MPELPEVQTTVNGINQELKNLRIIDVWTSYNSVFHLGKNNIKNPEYFARFKKDVIGTKIINASRVGKNVLIHLSNNKTILTHMKMTGHFMYGKYIFDGKNWTPANKAGPLNDPYNRHVRLIFSLSDKKHLAFCDTRKFGKVFIFETKDEKNIADLSQLGPDPLSKAFTYKVFKEQIFKKKHWVIKQTLLNQEIIAGIGNIYSDEILWSAGVHPLSITYKIPDQKLKLIYENSKKILKKGINFGGDSESDYRNIHGEPGKFQNKHNAYRKTGDKCSKKDCFGKIIRTKAAGRSAHFCNKHQILYK